MSTKFLGGVRLGYFSSRCPPSSMSTRAPFSVRVCAAMEPVAPEPTTMKSWTLILSDEPYQNEPGDASASGAQQDQKDGEEIHLRMFFGEESTAICGARF